jgi:hypothetical protein
MTTFFDQLERELDGAARRLHRGRRRRALATRVAAAAAIVVAVLGFAVVVDRGGDGNSAQAELLVVDEGDFVTVTLPRDHEQADEVERRLTEAGLQVRTEPTPTGPSLVNLVVGLIGPGGGESSAGTLTARVPKGSTITLRVGAPAANAYTAFTDALAPGEALHCIAWVGQDAEDVVNEVPAGVFARYRVEGVTEDLPVDDIAGRGYVLHDAIALGPDNVSITLEPGTPVPQPPC